MKNALIIFFNTDFSKNIPILEQIYGPRFSNILYIVPDHSSRLRQQYDDHKIPYAQVNKKDRLLNKARRLAGKKNAHELTDKSFNSKIERVIGFQYFFQDYFWQARKRILAMDAQWYWFVSDDVFINPAFNEQNILDVLSSNKDLSFISAPHHPSNAWINWFQGSTEQAVNKLKQTDCLPIEFTNLDFQNDVNQPGPYEKSVVAGCSDIFAIHKSRISKFLDYCHQTALEKIFVELAIPNILLTHCSAVSFVNDYVWDFDMNRGDWAKVERFLNSEKFYYHPVKLSLLDQKKIQTLIDSK